MRHLLTPTTTPTARFHAPLLVAASLASLSFSAAAQYSTTAGVDGHLLGSTTTPGDVSYAYDSGAGVSAVIAFTSSPIASVSYAASAFNPLGQIAVSGGGNMTYRFEVTAQPFTSVPIDFSGLYSSYQGSRGSAAQTLFSIQTVNSSVSTYATFQSYLYGCDTPGCLQYTTFGNTTYTSVQSDALHVEGAFQGMVDMLTGADGKVVGQVDLRASAYLNHYFINAGATTFIDPHLEIDAGFVAANPGATLTITPGVGNDIAGIPAVPEPSTYALLLGSVALVGAATRRKTKR